MRTLVTMFGKGDVEKTLLAMRCLPYDRLVLIGEEKDEETAGIAELRRLESMTGNEVIFERVGVEDFMGLVDGISEVISKHLGTGGKSGDVVLNISGGTKLMADAALFAAFRLGVPTYHVSDRVVRLPVMKGVTARNRFTPLQTQFISALESPRTLTEMESTLRHQSRQSLERIMRELRKMGLVSARLLSGQIEVSLTGEGLEARRVLSASNGHETS